MLPPPPQSDSSLTPPATAEVADPAASPGVARLDARSLRGLAHPMRVTLLGLLRTEGPATATALANRVGESSGVTSYHLRQLAAYGFIEVDPAPRASRRERWWRPVHQSTELRPMPDADPETRALTDEYLRAVAVAYIDRISGYVGSLATARVELGERWADVGDLSDYWLELTADEAEELASSLHAVLGRYRVAQPGSAPTGGRERVVVQLQVMPIVTEVAR